MVFDKHRFETPSFREKWRLDFEKEQQNEAEGEVLARAVEDRDAFDRQVDAMTDELLAEEMTFEEDSPEKTLLERLSHPLIHRTVRLFQFATIVSGLSAQVSREELGAAGELVLDEAFQDSIDSIEQTQNAGKDTMIEMAKSNPYELVGAFDAFKDEPYAEEVLLTVAETEPMALEKIVKSIEDEPYFNAVIEGMIATDPVNFYYRYHVADAGSVLHDVYVGALVAEVIEKSSDREVKAFQMIDGSDLTHEQKTHLLFANQYFADNRTEFENAVALMNNPGKYVEGVFYVIQHGSKKERELGEWRLREIIEVPIQKMNEFEHGKSGRFDILTEASSEMLYAMNVYGGDIASRRETTAARLVDAFVKKLQKENVSAHEFIEKIDGVGFHEFVTLASTVGKFDDFLRLAKTPEEKQGLLDRFFRGITVGDTDKKVSAVAEALVHGKDAFLLREAAPILKEEYLKAVGVGDKAAESAYGTLSELLGKKADWLGDRASEYRVELNDTLEVSELLNERGENVQAFYFYNDEDGYYSFANFLQTYRPSQGWDTVDHGTFVEITKSSGEGDDSRTIAIYANKPMASIAGLAWKHIKGPEDASNVLKKFGVEVSLQKVPSEYWIDGQPNGFEDMRAYMEEHERVPSVQVHRGHSYYTLYTQQMITAQTKFYFDGSCGGANDIDSIFREVPDVQAIYNSDTGKAGVNDIILSKVNERILAGRDIDWREIRIETDHAMQEFYQDDAISQAKAAYSRYVFPHEEKAKAARVEAKYKSLVEAL